MNILMIVLRLVHIFGGVYWVGTQFFQLSVLTPAVALSGPEGKKFMQALVAKTKFSAYMGIAATLTMLSGLVLYGIIYGFRLSVFQSPSGLTLTLGAIFGLASWAHGFFSIRVKTERVSKIAAEIESAGKPPSPAQMQAIQDLSQKIEKAGQISAVLSAVSLLGMAIAQYVG